MFVPIFTLFLRTKATNDKHRKTGLISLADCSRILSRLVTSTKYGSSSSGLSYCGYTSIDSRAFLDLICFFFCLFRFAFVWIIFAWRNPLSVSFFYPSGYRVRSLGVTYISCGFPTAFFFFLSFLLTFCLLVFRYL